MTFVDVWVGYAIFGVIAFSAVLVWAVRTRQFTDFDRARHLALNAEKSVEKVEKNDRVISRLDRFGLILLLFITLALLVSGILVGIRSMY